MGWGGPIAGKLEENLKAVSFPPTSPGVVQAVSMKGTIEEVGGRMENQKQNLGGLGRKLLSLALSGLLLTALMGCGAPASDESVATPLAVVTAEELPKAAELPTTVPPPPTENSGPAPTKPPATAVKSAQVPEPTTDPEPTVPAQPVVAGVTLALADASRARYLVREQLARLDFPNDAVGETSQVTGAITLDADGRVISDESTIVVNLASLVSDSDRRDGYVHSRTLETDTYPDATLVVKEAPGLPWPLPTQGEATFQIVGDMTIKGVTRPLTWDATAQFGEESVTGQAKTAFTFGEFGIAVPRVRVVLSVDDNIRLELDFTCTLN